MDKYGWVDMGSSFLPSDMIAAVLFAQLENLELIQKRRKEIWYKYALLLKPLQEKRALQIPDLPEYASNNAHMFLILVDNETHRAELLNHLKNNQIHAVFHYLSLHDSPFHKEKHDGRVLPNSSKFMNTLIRLPFFFELSEDKIEYIASEISAFYEGK